MSRRRKPPSPFHWFDSSLEVIRTAVLMYLPYAPSPRDVEDLLHQRAIEPHQAGAQLRQ